MNIFISHSHRDKAIVYKIAEDLKQYGMTIWLDEELITPGDNWLEKINKAMVNSDAILIVVSQNISSSKWQTSEIAFAVSAQRQYRTKKIIPILVDRDAEIPFFIKDLLYCNFTSDNAYKHNFNKLIKALQEPVSTPETIDHSDKLKINSIRIQKEILARETTKLDHKRVMRTSLIIGAISSMIAALSIMLSFSIWVNYQSSLDGLISSNKFVIGVLSGVLSSLIAIIIVRMFSNRSTRRGAKNGK